MASGYNRALTRAYCGETIEVRIPQRDAVMLNVVEFLDLQFCPRQINSIAKDGERGLK
jgi:hypothetical protein